ncbi:uncharacterized protein LOC110720124 [Chenopodium quinoa]|uniref:uncharacterized protein LOC110720124 n=1 Tax=Chenopodium quinoa TaxID=63459 RepID=UPI000B78212A|nr:uncharacterized protein LOC110720124 [Chenopodium quinoa]
MLGQNCENEVCPVVMEEVTLEDESEDEDVDFNPFLKESLSEEASSSLSSEVDGLDIDVVNSHVENVVPVDTHGLFKGMNDVVHEGECGDVSKRDSELILNQENDKVLEKENGLNSGADGVEDVGEADMGLISSRNKPVIDLDDEDAICRRTRARYSLASFTLDELETFLQETDDEDDIQNVDEEEEYKKFLAAVLNGGNGDQGNLAGNDDDDDEDNDADFEIEIEEALESDIDDCVVTPNKDERFERAIRRPETRRKGQKKANAQNKKKVMQQENRPLRPLLPVMSSASFPCLGPRCVALETSLQSPQCDQGVLPNGFQPHQIGQLHCIIYEHVQLLVQVYSLCVLEPSRQHIASQIKGLLAELLHKRDLVLSWRNGPYSISCFYPSSTCSSVSVENKDSNVSPNDGQGCRWSPVVGDSVLSVLDVAPLKLVGRYIDDVSKAVREHQRRCVETTNTFLEKQPLFPLAIQSSPEVDHNVSKGDGPSSNTCEVSPSNKGPKKTLAATLVESTKKQPVALVPQQITKLALPFYSLFNPALFPHKPPSPAVANRVLFTDAEDVLLAMGIMEYNNDWKSIQQRFLPCKSEHQIFVRAKNRCSAKAPENPIKAVRKMKTSPLTEVEKARIQEGLKAFKLDWTSVWRTMVPYRDPNLLPRQWRTAIGTQKSYKFDSARRERHRVYESNRRRNKAAAMDYSQTGSEKENESGEDFVDNDNEAYVHEAFLADWRPTLSGVDPSKISSSSFKLGCLHGDVPVASSSATQSGADNHRNREIQINKGHAYKGLAASENSHLIHYNSLHPHVSSSQPPPIPTSETFSESLSRSQRAGKPSVSNLVKLAPELPPVKLPSAVRIISQASLRNTQFGSSSEVCASSPAPANLVKHVQDNTMIPNPNFESLPSQKDGLLKNGSLTKERGTKLDPQMHPLLFRTIEEGHLPCYPVNNPMRIPTFSFFPPMQHQMNVTLLRNPCPAGPDASLKFLGSKESASASSSLDFHPLLQRAKEIRANSIDTGMTDSLLNTDLELSRDQYVEDIVYDAGATAAQMAAATRLTSPNADANDLDLDIHLSSASKRRENLSKRDEINLSFPSLSGSSVVESVTMHGDSSQLAELQPADPVGQRHMEISIPDNSSAVSNTVDGSYGSCINDNVSVHPPLEIVMEQEELSDSDEEMEDVEFEREEMEDSDGEVGSDAEEVINMHNKVIQEQSRTVLGTDDHAQLLRSLASGVSERTRSQRKRSPRLGLTGTGKDHSKDSWLSLNSHGSHCKPLSRTKRAESPSRGGPVLSSPNRYRKKAVSSSKDVSSSDKQTDISLQDPFSTPSRKSRKQALKNSSL